MSETPALPIPNEAIEQVYDSPDTDTEDGSVTWDLAKNCVIGVCEEEDGSLTVFATISQGGVSERGNICRTAAPEQVVDFAVRLIQFATNRRARADELTGGGA